jgi:hypothetical protein
MPDNDNTNIFIIENGKTYKLSEYDFSRKVNIATEILEYYSGQAGERELDVKAIYTENKPRDLMSVQNIYNTDGKLIKSTARMPLVKGKFNQLFDNKNNLKNTIQHESKHKQDAIKKGELTPTQNMAESDVLNASNELSAIEYQKTKQEWDKTTATYKKHIINYEKENKEKLRKAKTQY